MINKTTLTLLLTCLIPLPGYASDYSVEAIIFTNTKAANTPALHWDNNAPRIIKAQNKLDRLYLKAATATKARKENRLNTPAEASENENGRALDTTISHELVELRGIHNKLQQSQDHEILQTLSWNQSEAGYQSSPLINTLTPHMKGVIRVYAPNLLFAEVNLTYVPDEILPDSLLESMDGGTGEAVALPEPTTYNSVDYGSEYSLQTAVKPPIIHYFMDEQRKLKLNEIHYFDHPRFGVILNVKPIENPAPQAS